MPRMVCHNLIPAIVLSDFFSSLGFTILGIDYSLGDPIHLHTDEEGFDKAAWITKSRQQATVNSLLIHTSWWTAQAMGYKGV